MAIYLLAVLFILGVCDCAEAWGLVTHVELAETALAELAFLSTVASAIVLKNRKDFLLGNILADVIMGKKFSRRRRAAHHWPAAQRVLTNAETDHERAFAYGLLTHLAADTVAHNHYIPSMIQQSGATVGLGHLYWEARADHLVDAAHRATAKKLLKYRHHAHEQLLASHVFPESKWFGLNRSLFAGVNRMVSGRKFRRAVGFCGDLSRWDLCGETFEKNKAESVRRMIQLLTKGHEGELTKLDPNGLAVLKELGRDKLAG